MTRDVRRHGGERGCGMNRPVVVAGMHRSGTSLVTQIVAELGLHPPRDEDLLPGDSSNPSGHWESKRLMRFDDALLLAFGGWTMAPPRLRPGWEHSARARLLRPIGRWAFDRTYPSGGWVWKDPQVCLTLPFWRATWRTQPVVVYVRRSPGAVCSSLARRDGLRPELALAVWERYIRSLMESLDGSDAFCLDYDELLQEPLRWVVQLSESLAAHGVTMQRDAGVVADLVKPSLSHHGGGLPNEASVEQQRLYDVVSSLPCCSDSIAQLELGPETPGLQRWFAAELPRQIATAFYVRRRTREHG